MPAARPKPSLELTSTGFAPVRVTQIAAALLFCAGMLALPRIALAQSPVLQRSAACEKASPVMAQCDPAISTRDRNKPEASETSPAIPTAAAGKGDAQATPTYKNGAQQLETVTVKARREEPPPGPSVHAVFEKALGPAIPPLTTVDHDLSGNRVECIAQCTGPFCCVTTYVSRPWWRP